MMTRRGLCAGLTAGIILPGCATRPGTGYRDPGIPLTVTTRDGLAALDGTWFVRAHFPGDDDLEKVSFQPGGPDGSAVRYAWGPCLVTGACQFETETAPSRPLGQNRLQVSDTSRAGAREIWLVWIDEGRRTAAIGTPDGSFAWILDRMQTGGQDRISAARDILAFTGYDTARMTLRDTV